MRNIWRLFIGDLKRIGGNTITTLVVLGLVLLPSLFSWFNLIACWDVFGNTGQLTVAVANSDDGYESDLVPLRVNVGERVMSALRENDQLNWVFTNEEDAIDGTKSGRYYAAVVIPEDFSRNMLTFYESNEESATIFYYANDKKSAIAPKVTDQGADQISAQVNRVFSETLSEIALAISSSLYDYADSADINGRIGELAGHLSRVSKEMGRTASIINLYAEVVETAQALVDDSTLLLSEARTSADAVVDTASNAKAAADSTTSSLEDAIALLGEAFDQSTAGFSTVPDAVDAAFNTADTLSADAASNLRNRAAAIDSIAGKLHQLASELAKIEAFVPEDIAQDLANLVTRVENAAQLQDQLRDGLNGAADNLEAGASSSQETREQVKELAVQASNSLELARSEYESNLKPTLSDLSSTLDNATNTLAATGGKLDAIGDEMNGVSAELKEGMSDTSSKLTKAAANLDKTAGDIEQLAKDITKAISSGDAAELRKIIGANPAALAAVLSEPVTLERIAVYPVENFGSAMSPLYTTLALWIGALLMMVTLKVLPSNRTIRELNNPSPSQLFCGRFGVVAVISLAQSTVMCLGNLLFLGVQAEHPLLYLLCFWVAGLVFAFIIYTLVASFGNLGKALAVLLLILQVSGGGGSFPLLLLPDLIQNISPFLPVTHVVNAMRASMFGIYNGDFWIEMGMLLLFAVPFLLLGLVFRNPLIKVVARYVERVEASKLM